MKKLISAIVAALSLALPLQAESQAEVLDAKRITLKRFPKAPVPGNKKGAVTVVCFFADNCPYCRRATPETQGFAAADPNARLVYGAWPPLDKGSAFAARAAQAARKQGLDRKFHWAMMGMSGLARKVSVLRIAEGIGRDIAQLRRDMGAPEIAAYIHPQMRLAQDPGKTGAPSFVTSLPFAPGVGDLRKRQMLFSDVREPGQ